MVFVSVSDFVKRICQERERRFIMQIFTTEVAVFELLI